MSVDNVILWYEKNVNYKLTKSFINFLIKIGIIKDDVNLDLLNSFLLEYYGNELVKESDKFKIKENRKSIIDNFKDKEEEKNIINIDIKDKPKNKFKIENLGGKRLKLIKI